MPCCSGSDGMGPKPGPFPTDNISMLRVVVTCVYVLHTTLVSYVNSRTGRTSISTGNYQRVRTVRKLVVCCMKT